MTTAISSQLSIDMTPPTVALSADLDVLVDQEVKQVRAFYTRHDRARELPGDQQKFVRKCLKRHLPLIRMWKDWRFELPLTESFVAPEDIREEMADITSKWRDGVVLKNRTYPPLSFRTHRSAEDALFCETLGCHVPGPKFRSELWTQKTAQAGYEGGVEYAFGASVKIRKGQTISKAVLAAVRKRYKNNEAYVAFWEAIMESLGVQYASVKPYRVVLSTAPSDFMQLGLLGESSCYTTGGDWERAKIHLAIIPNSVIVLIYREGTVEPVGRAWGVLAPKTGGAELTNFYLLPRTQVLPGLLTAIQAALKAPAPLVELGEGNSWATIVREHLYNTNMYAYVNPDAITVGPAAQHVAVQAEILQYIETFRNNKDHIDSSGEFPTCQQCTRNEGAPTTCRNCSVGACAACVVTEELSGENACERCATQKGWFHCSCGTWTTGARECKGSFHQYCRKCAKKKLLACGRCNGKYELQFLVICDACKQVRCKKCTRSEEITCTLCIPCQRNAGLLPPEPEPALAAPVWVGSTSTISGRTGVEAILARMQGDTGPTPRGFSAGYDAHCNCQTCQNERVQQRHPDYFGRGREMGSYDLPGNWWRTPRPEDVLHGTTNVAVDFGQAIDFGQLEEYYLRALGGMAVPPELVAPPITTTAPVTGEE